MRRFRGDDTGFTLMELLMAIVIMGVITVPLGNFVLAYFDNYQTTENRVSDSHDIQIATAYFSADVANTGLRSASAPYSPAQSIWTTAFPATYCGSGLGTTVVLFKGDSWTVSSGASPTGTNAPISVAYVATGGTLRRVYCQTGSVTTSSTTVVHNLVSATASCFTSGGAGTSCEAATPPPKVRLTLSISGGTQDAAAPPQPVTLDGLRRQS